MRSHINKQQRAILLIAMLGILRLQGRSKPERKDVLAFIRIKQLMDWDEDDLDWCDAYCLVGDNHISWRRKDLVMDGFIVSRPGTASWGIWELSKAGLARAEQIINMLKEGYEKNPKAFEELKTVWDVFKLTDHFFNLVLQLGNRDFSTHYYPAKTISYKYTK